MGKPVSKKYALFLSPKIGEEVEKTAEQLDVAPGVIIKILVMSMYNQIGRIDGQTIESLLRIPSHVRQRKGFEVFKKEEEPPNVGAGSGNEGGFVGDEENEKGGVQ